ncbi:M20/M25/M40 family metallo-hydrolase [Cytobacillus firmus]|uniref:Peptidase M20 n=1 Tax=Cytobacillus firmus DS1 TaxID=1307436 RepID=W7LD60_CYTFI|nr:M20/M25/M40 family metallo-hydrolase [Cytobacillus firmus]EWG09949.1 peptidase M20 [Cytobacillus firmus DS1]
MTHTFSFQSPKQLKDTLCDLVSIPSVTLTEGERHFPLRVEQLLRDIPYFEKHPSQIMNHPMADGRFVLTALYRHDEASKTVVMISHFDVVDIDDYGDLKHLAFYPEELTRAMKARADRLPADVRADLESGDWLFGRGTMDMKCGLVQHLSLIEKASSEEWKINLLLLAVPDEEVNSRGMREVIPKLLDLSEEYDLTYSLFLNSEPMFSQIPQDEKYYFYTGSIGKIMPGALCFGRETHVGEPFSGINAGWMSSVLTQEMEWNPMFCETVNGKTSPPPTLLLQKDLKKEYSTQIPHRSVSLYNLLLMKKSPADVMEEMKRAAEIAAKKMENFIIERYRSFNLEMNEAPDIRVFFYEQLRDFAVKKTSEDYIAILEQSIARDTQGDIREQTIQIADQISMLCQELGPMIVLFYAPPYYPAINTADHKDIQSLSSTLVRFTREEFGKELHAVDYFNGISDLSYAGLQGDLSEMECYNSNLPGGQELYSIPFDEMSQFKAPVINVGPIGRDAHQKTERLHMPFAFEQLPKILEHLILEHASS